MPKSLDGCDDGGENKAHTSSWNRKPHHQGFAAVIAVIATHPDLSIEVSEILRMTNLPSPFRNLGPLRSFSCDPVLSC